MHVRYNFGVFEPDFDIFNMLRGRDESGRGIPAETITPIPKGGDSHDPGNWRPIIILSLLSKIMERALHFQLINYFEENGYLHRNQHGFRKNCSTATAVFKLSRDLHSAYDLGYSTSCIFVDYKIAFETLSHRTLLEKMHAYGLRKYF